MKEETKKAIKEETKKAIKQEFVKLGKDILSHIVITFTSIVVILITDSDSKLDDTFIPFIDKIKTELLGFIEKA